MQKQTKPYKTHTPNSGGGRFFVIHSDVIECRYMPSAGANPTTRPVEFITRDDMSALKAFPIRLAAERHLVPTLVAQDDKRAQAISEAINYYAN